MMNLNEDLERKLFSDLNKSAALRTQATDIIDDINSLLSGYNDLKFGFPNDNTASLRPGIIALLNNANEQQETKAEELEVRAPVPESNTPLDFFSRGNVEATMSVAPSNFFVNQTEILEKLRLYKELVELETDTEQASSSHSITGYIKKMIGLGTKSAK